MIIAAGDDHQRCLQRVDSLDRAEGRAVDAEASGRGWQRKPRDERTQSAERTKPGGESMLHRQIDGRIHRFEHHRVGARGIPAGKQGCAQRNTDDSHALKWSRRSQEGERRLRIEPLAMAEGDVLAAALAMRLKVGHENGKAGAMEKSRTGKHREPILSGAVQQQHRAASRASIDEPGGQRTPGGARDRDASSGLILRHIADACRGGAREHACREW
ncbi:MAG: hypothetical protein M3081_18040 [Gemmatimonadota bacterium]|nr:hypothetical protein [Gemmatimonadota bacterium]